jgi:hypothetical protein
MSIVLVGSTSGSVTLQEPAVAGTTVLTLPAVSGTILTTASSGQSIPKAALPTGSVLQVVNATYSTETTTTSTSFVDTGLSGSITPLYSTSKILVIATINGTGKGAATQMAFKLLRGSTSLFNYESSATYTASADSNYVGSCGVEYLDSPSTTSSTTYKVQFRSVGGGIIYSQSSGAGDGSTSSITLMEIAG